MFKYLLTLLDICIILILDISLIIKYNFKLRRMQMSFLKVIFKSLLVFNMVAIPSTLAFAHTSHDHSQLPYKWEFSKNVKKKIERHINSTTPNGIVGLSRFEQRKLGIYGINVGNKFSSSIGGVDALIERTTMGIRIIQAKNINSTNSEWLIPIRSSMNISKVSLIKFDHSGHDHRVRDIEWAFGAQTNDKIVKRAFSSNGEFLVGLNSFEQRLLDEYEINVGNRFYISISGHKLAAKRTTAGLKIDIARINSGVAKAATNISDDNV